MIKKTIFLALMTTTFFTNAFFLESVFKLKEGAEQQRIAADELSKNRYAMKVGREKSFPGQGMIPSRTTFYTEAAIKSFDKYIEIEGSLGIRIFASQCIDGFILGLLAACCNAQLDFPLPIICATIATALSLVMHQNSVLGSVPYFDPNLKRHEYEYKLWSVQTLLNVACILTAANLGAYSFKQIANA